MKKCTNGGEEKALNFFGSRSKKTGGGLKSHCKKCEWTVYGSKILIRGTPERTKRKRSQWAARCRSRSAAIGLTCNLSGDQITEIWNEQSGKCALTGIDLKEEAPEGATGAEWNSPSMDRIDSKLGYTKNNCRIIIYCINAFRGNMTDDQMYELAKLLLANRRN